MERDTGGRAKDGLHLCQGCGTYLPQKTGKPGRRRIWCDQCCPWRRVDPRAGLVCIECGGPTPRRKPGQRGRNLLYCSRRCSRKADSARQATRAPLVCDGCGTTFFGPEGKRYCSESCRWPVRLDTPVKCKECDGLFVRVRHGDKLCSSTCKIAAKQKAAAATVARNKKRGGPPNECLCCRKPFRKRSSGRNSGKYCSRECAFEARRMRLPCTQLGRRLGTPLSAQLAVWFHNWGNDADDTHEQGPRQGGHKARCRQYGCHYEPFPDWTIFDRDGWTCQICGVELLDKWTTIPGTNSPDPRSPEIDHIIPLSFGIASPGHRPSNVQASCRKCNGKKSNRLVTPLHSNRLPAHT